MSFYRSDAESLQGLFTDADSLAGLVCTQCVTPRGDLSKYCCRNCFSVAWSGISVSSPQTGCGINNSSVGGYIYTASDHLTLTGDQSVNIQSSPYGYCFWGVTKSYHNNTSPAGLGDFYITMNLYALGVIPVAYVGVTVHIPSSTGGIAGDSLGNAKHYYCYNFDCSGGSFVSDTGTSVYASGSCGSAGITLPSSLVVYGTSACFGTGT